MLIKNNFLCRWRVVRSNADVYNAIEVVIQYSWVIFWEFISCISCKPRRFRHLTYMRSKRSDLSLNSLQSLLYCVLSTKISAYLYIKKVTNQHVGGLKTQKRLIDIIRFKKINLFFKALSVKESFLCTLK